MRARRTGLILTGGAAAAAITVIAMRHKGASAPPKARTGAFSNGIEYAAIGDGPRTVIFLPGGPGTVPYAGFWARMGNGILRPLVEAGFTVWRLSRRRNMPPGHTVADMADDVADVINEAFGGYVDVVVGLSYGGTIALLLAARHPDAVGRVALVASSAAITDVGRETDRRFGEALGHGRFTEGAQALLEEMLPPGRTRRRVMRLLAPLVGRILASAGYNLADVLVETQAEMDVDARPVLHQITAPVLIIAGDQDIFFTREIVEETTRLIPDCTVVRYEGRSHGGTASDKRVPRDLLTFLKRDVRTKRTLAPSISDLCDALEVSGTQLSRLLRQVSDPTPLAIGTWTIGETANHVAGSAHAFLAVARGESPPELLDDVDAGNARALAADPERDPRVLAGRFDDGERALVAHARLVRGDPPVEPFAGAEVPFSTLLGVELGEVLVHGYDIARATGRPWRIDPHHAALALQGYIPLLPHMLDRDRAAGVKLAIDLRIRGVPPVVARIEDGVLGVEDSQRQRVDCHLSVEPVAYLLLTWNRINPLAAVLRGQMLPWGRRPWKVAAFGELLST